MGQNYRVIVIVTWMKRKKRNEFNSLNRFTLNKYKQKINYVIMLFILRQRLSCETIKSTHLLFFKRNSGDHLEHIWYLNPFVRQDVKFSFL